MAKAKQIPPRVLTTEEAREIGRKGGIASGIARAERKSLREELGELLKAIDSGETDNNNKRISVALMAEALKGNTKAFEIIRDTVGEKPKEELDIKGNMNFSNGELSEILDELKKG